VYGAEMPNQSLYNLVSMIRRGWFFFIGKPGASANYIQVDNVVEALLLCAQTPEASGQVYNLSDRRTLEDFVAYIAQSLGVCVPRTRLPEMPIRALVTLIGGIPGMPLTQTRVDALTARAIYSDEKIERELGYRHVVSMEEGLQELVKAYKQQFSSL
jgi:nucleoside-diphosphate-sugar epimerase